MMIFKKEILLFLLVKSVLISNPFPLVAQKLDEVVKKYTESIWGDTDINSIKSLLTYGYILNENGNPDYYILQELKMPNLIKTTYFTEPNGLRFTIAYDGEGGWKLNTNKDSVSVERLSQERSKDLLSNIAIAEPFIQPEKSGVKVELIGKKKFAGGDNYEITVEFKDGKSKGYYIDSNEYQLNYSGEITNGNSEIKYLNFTHYKNYRKVNGVFFPFLQEEIFNSYGKTTTFKILRIEVNPEFSENHFKMP